MTKSPAPRKFGVTIHTDGSCCPNPGPGGWGAIITDHRNGQVRELAGRQRKTTNNRMEMTAALMALEALSTATTVRMVSDSQYLINGMTKWMPGWRRKGWQATCGKPVKNADLWRSLDEASGRHMVTWEWIKGHSGDALNERADRLASGRCAMR